MAYRTGSAAGGLPVPEKKPEDAPAPVVNAWHERPPFLNKKDLKEDGECSFKDGLSPGTHLRLAQTKMMMPHPILGASKQNLIGVETEPDSYFLESDDDFYEEDTTEEGLDDDSMEDFSPHENGPYIKNLAKKGKRFPRNGKLKRYERFLAALPKSMLG